MDLIYIVLSVAKPSASIPEEAIKYDINHEAVGSPTPFGVRSNDFVVPYPCKIPRKTIFTSDVEAGRLLCGL